MFVFASASWDSSRSDISNRLQEPLFLPGVRTGNLILPDPVAFALAAVAIRETLNVFPHRVFLRLTLPEMLAGVVMQYSGTAVEPKQPVILMYSVIPECRPCGYDEQQN